MHGETANLIIASAPFMYLLLIPASVLQLMKVINHFLEIWDVEEKFMEISLALVYCISFISFMAFFFVVISLDNCA